MQRIPLTRGRECFVDDDIFDEVCGYRWDVSNGYVKRDSRVNGQHTTIYLHRYIMNTPQGMDTDHINGNKFDNQRSNLRICTRSQNTHNAPKHSDNGSGFKGVSLQGGKYARAQIMHNGKRIHIGYFPTVADASKAYDDMARKLFGEFVRGSVTNAI
jgi:hypothetical protein